MSYRFILAVDVQGDDLREACSNLAEIMGRIDSEELQWESTDEAYDPGGHQILVDDIVEVTCAHHFDGEESIQPVRDFRRNPKERPGCHGSGCGGESVA